MIILVQNLITLKAYTTVYATRVFGIHNEFCGIQMYAVYAVCRSLKLTEYFSASSTDPNITLSHVLCVSKIKKIIESYLLPVFE